MAEESNKNWSSLGETNSLAGYVTSVFLCNGNENSSIVRLPNSQTEQNSQETAHKDTEPFVNHPKENPPSLTSEDS